MLSKNDGVTPFAIQFRKSTNLEWFCRLYWITHAWHEDWRAYFYLLSENTQFIIIAPGSPIKCYIDEILFHFGSF